MLAKRQALHMARAGLLCKNVRARITDQMQKVCYNKSIGGPFVLLIFQLILTIFKNRAEESFKIKVK